jgi:NADPH:quinone reductase-like Zn-dependent oxidoreductase
MILQLHSPYEPENNSAPHQGRRPSPVFHAYKPAAMKAAVHTRYGPPEVVQVKDIPKPIPGPKEVLVRVHTATVNRTDCGFRSAEYFISRFWSGLFKPRQQTLGCEFAGVVEALGTQASQFAIGDRVFGYNDIRFGAHAEYLCIGEDEVIATIPDNLSFDQAAPVMEGAHYALHNIREAGIKAGQTAMVYGATGAIGSAAVQLLKHFGVHVTAVCNNQNVALMHQLGADVVIDYQTQDYTRSGQTYHFIFDAVGKSSFSICKPLLKEKGIYVSTELGKGGSNVWLALITPLFKGRKVIFPLPVNSKEDLLFLRLLAAEGIFRPVIDRIFPLEEIVEAYRYAGSGQKTGNVLVRVR